MAARRNADSVESRRRGRDDDRRCFAPAAFGDLDHVIRRHDLA
jgi:hypothetical protein